MQRLIPFIKITVSVCIILFLLVNLDHTNVLNTLKVVDINLLVGASVVFLIGQILSARRYQILVKVCNGQISFFYSLKIHFIGLFFNQILPSGMGGDVVKGIYASTILSIRQATISVISDRAFGLVIMCLLFLLFGPYYYSLLDNQNSFYFLILVGISGVAWLPIGIFGFCILKSYFTNFYKIIINNALVSYINSFLQYFLKSIKLHSAELFTISLVIHFSGIAAYFLIARALGVNASFISYSLMVPLIFLFALAPISIAGWGVREASSIWFLGQIGATPENAFAISILFGFMLIIVSLPGVVLFAKSKNR